MSPDRNHKAHHKPHEHLSPLQNWQHNSMSLLCRIKPFISVLLFAHSDVRIYVGQTYGVSVCDCVLKCIQLCTIGNVTERQGVATVFPTLSQNVVQVRTPPPLCPPTS